ncbi:MAG: ABC transporter ATP-binding protein [Deltaproteobacteria bacterium]|jgi:ATP-binding cassette subfamily C protein|nr:ABC transporter ATP-binding protein [Deltaproteobacteria bacterium]
MRILITFASRYPLQSALMLLALLLAGIVEGFGLTALMPLRGMAFSSQPQAAALQPTAVTGNDAGVGQAVTRVLAIFGLEPGAGVLLLVIVVAIALKSALVLVAQKRVGYTVAQVATELRLSLLRALLISRWEYFLRQPVGSLANAMATEAMRAANAYLCGALMTANLIQALVYIVIALMISWRATLACSVASIIILFILSRLIRKARRAGVRQTEVFQSLLAHLTDSLQSIKPLKSMAREGAADAMLQTETRRLNKALRKQVFAKEALRALQEPMIIGFLALGLYVAMIYFQLSLASVTVLVFLLARLMSQMGRVQRHYQKMMISESAYWSLQDKIEEARNHHETTLGGQEPVLKRAIRMDGVSFGYEDLTVLENASLSFPAGSFTTIVGPSGAGKTTVVDLLIGLLRPQKGEIWVDDLSLADIDIRRWRRMIGYVPQETLLLHDSVKVNVTLGDPSLKAADVERALRAAGAWDFVAAMPQGMDSSVGERGGMLSGGQRQRIAIARALVHDPALLILDEATSALDPESELAIGRTLQQLSGKLTIVAISHQPALMRTADRTYRLQNGSVDLVADADGPAGQPAAAVDGSPS